MRRCRRACKSAFCLVPRAGSGVAEACGLWPGDIDLALGMIHPKVKYPAAPLTTDTSMMAVPVPRPLTSELMAHKLQWPVKTVPVVEARPEQGRNTDKISESYGSSEP
jgi:hypothetical protein